MFNQTLEYFSGYPLILAPNGPERLRNAQLDGRPIDVYLDRRGNRVQVHNLTRDYHLYILVSRWAAVLDGAVTWDAEKRVVSLFVKFETRPTSAIVPAIVALDGSSPYPIPRGLDVENISAVYSAPGAEGGDLTGLVFVHKDGSQIGFWLSPDLFHYLKFRKADQPLTDFRVEYVGIACGENGDVSVFDRAKAHERIVELQGDLQQRHRNRDLFIMAYDPAYRVVGQDIVTMPAMLERLMSGKMKSIYEAIEASLIGYFQPKYNIQFKDFPKNKPHWLNGEFRAFNGPALLVERISVTLVSDSSYNSPGDQWSFGRLASADVPPDDLHFVEFDGLR
ncbi:hypothetical protein [Agrobacterium sp. lyk4-40-TYG-31]|uniref:hypothetical protein n=1 Tax=Agrobacterium sp. lyk4-40-TYG-31 TaxID=3040276 RepID=UPI00254DE4BB|nr:hypothetical protein [Agrobacterium sp. lyk4-40-TYG-31]